MTAGTPSVPNHSESSRSGDRLLSGVHRARRAILQPRLPWMLVIPALLVAIALLAPIAYLVIRASEAGSDLWPLIFRERTWIIFRNTLQLVAAVSLTTIVIAVPYAWLTTRTDLPGRRFWSIIAPLPLVIPSYAGALALIGSLGPRGIVQKWLEPFGVDRLPEIYGFLGAWAALSLFTYPYVFLSVRSAIRGLDPGLEEASRGLHHGSWSTFFRCILPQLRPAIAAGALLCALYTIADFGVVSQMRYDAFASTIYTQYRSAFDRTLAASLGLILVLLALALVAGEGALRGRASYHRLGSGSNRRARVIALGGWRWPALFFVAIIPVLALGVPIATLAYWLITGASGGADLGDLPRAAANSFFVGAATAVVATFAALPVAILSVRYAWSRLSRSMERMTYLGYALPGIVVALAFVFVGARYVSPLYQTLPWMILALVVRFIPQGVGATRASLLQISPRLEESSRSLGRGGYGTLIRITAPLALPGISAGAALVFLTVLKELPVTLLLSPTGFDTLAGDIWHATDAGRYGQAAAPALLLIGLSLIPTILLSARAERAVRPEVDVARPAEPASIAPDRTLIHLGS
jgi:iron(III) transport system permease protein